MTEPAQEGPGRGLLPPKPRPAVAKQRGHETPPRPGRQRARWEIPPPPPALIGADCACAPRRRAAPEVLTWRRSPSPGPGSPCSAPGGTCPALLFPPPRRGPGALGLGGCVSICRRLKHREGLLGLGWGVLAPLSTPAAPGSPVAAGRRFGIPRKAV